MTATLFGPRRYVLIWLLGWMLLLQVGCYLFRAPSRQDSAQAIKQLSDQATFLVEPPHGESIYSLAFSSDGQMAATIAYNGVARVWDVDTGREIQRIRLSSPGYGKVAFSPDGQYLLTASCRIHQTPPLPIGIKFKDPGNHWVSLWKIDSGQEIRRLAVSSEGIHHARFSSEGSRIATLQSGKLQLWDCATGKELHLPGLTTRTDVQEFSFSTRHNHLLTVHQSGLVTTWDLETGTPVTQRRTTKTDEILCNTFSPEGKTLAQGQTNGQILVWETGANTPVKKLTGHQDRVTALTFSQDGKRLFSTGNDGFIRTWNLETGIELNRVKKHSAWDDELAISPDETLLLLTTGMDSICQLQDAKTGRELCRLQGSAIPIYAAAFSVDGNTLVLAGDQNDMRPWHGPCQNCTVSVWNLQTGQEQTRWSPRLPGVRSLAIFPDGQGIAIGGASGLQVSRLHTGQPDWANEFYADRLALSPNGQWLCASGHAGTVLFQATTGQKERELIRHPAFAIAFAPNGEQVATSHYQSVEVWDVATGQLLRRWEFPNQWIYGLAYTKDNQSLLIGNLDGELRRCDIATGKELWKVQDSSEGISQIVLSPDGKIAAIGREEWRVQFWEIEQGQVLSELQRNPEYISDIAFHPSGKIILTASQEASVRLWELATRNQLCLLAIQNDGNWMVVDQHNRFDLFAPQSMTSAHWVENKKPVFAHERYHSGYTPGLLAHLAQTSRGK
ncbi:MAG TPA: WD40 repeat domain-containing protein [Acidobacteriota bacterium]|nr:WD40 repeat domain-containing protein [Acidobacteriota bacterium]